MTLYISVSPDPAGLAERSVDVLEVLGGKAIAQYGRFVLSLAGGSTPRAVYALWAEKTQLDWSKVVLVFGDERCVPPDHEQSNYNMVAESLLAGLATQPTIVRMEGEAEDPVQAARNYDYALHELLGSDGFMHVALLGIGGDGHTASLFPRAAALNEGAAWCASTPAPDGSMQRLTLTVPALRNTRKLMFIATGADKADVLRRVLEGPLEPEALPAQFFLRDERLNVNLLLDEAAAAKLNRRE
jgi:6-phosphogluconolactonase